MSDKRALLKDLGARFRALREARGWTQQALCARAKVSRDTLHRLESGSVVDASSLVALLDALGHEVAFTPRRALRAADMRRLFADVHEEGDA